MLPEQSRATAREATAIRLTVEFDDDVAGAAEALVALLRRPEPNSEQDDNADATPDEDAAA